MLINKKMAGIRTYIEESADELRNKVSWPSWSELQSSSILVLVATFIIALVIWLMDVASSRVLDQLYKLLS